MTESRYVSGCLEPMAYYEIDTVPGALTVESPKMRRKVKIKNRKRTNHGQHVTALGGGWSTLLFMVEKLSNQKNGKKTQANKS